jgi:hypothetical protein
MKDASSWQQPNHQLCHHADGVTPLQDEEHTFAMNLFEKCKAEIKSADVNKISVTIDVVRCAFFTMDSAGLGLGHRVAAAVRCAPFHHGFCSVRGRAIGLRLMCGARFPIENLHSRSAIELHTFAPPLEALACV